jgi:hypothetical protein
VLEDAVDDAGPVEGREDGESSCDGRGSEAAYFLEPPQVQLDVSALSHERRQSADEAPAEVGVQVRRGVARVCAL